MPGAGLWRYEYSYDHTFADGVRPLHRLLKIVAPNGAETSYVYDGASIVPSRVTGPEGSGVTNTIVDGLVTESVDADGVRTTFTYDQQRRLVTLTNGIGDTSTLHRDQAGRLVGVTDPSGETTTMTYDQSGRLLSVTDPTGATNTRSYDDAGRLAGFADALDAVPGISSRASFSYDDAGLLTSAEDQRGNTTTFEHNGFGQVTSAEQAGGAEWTYDFAELGRMASATNPLEPGQPTSLEYDIDGQLTAVERADGSRASISYDIAGRANRVTDPNGIVTLFAYNSETGGRLASETYAAGTDDEITVTYDYDELYRLASLTGPRPGQVRTFTYTPGGRLATATNANGHTVTYRYDNAGRVSTVVLPGQREVRYVYDASSRVTAVVSPTGLRYQTTYDAAGRVMSLRSPAGIQTRFTYDGNGTVTSVQTGTDSPTSFDVDALVLNEATDPNGGSTEATYDGRYNLVRWVDQNGNATTADFDLADQLTASTDVLNRTTLIAYDDVGRVAAVADPSGRTFTPTYDAGDRLIAMTFVDGSSQSMHYDNLNRLRRVSDQDSKGKVQSSTSFDYDEASNLTKVIEPDGDVIRYEWDLVGNQTALMYPDGSRVDYHYDELSRMVSAVHSKQGKTGYQWDDDSRLTLVKFPDGKSRRYSYSGEQLTGFSDRNRHWKMSYDESGRLAKVTGHDYWAFEYDSGGQLIEAVQNRQSWSYSYDAVGNIVEVAERRLGHGRPHYQESSENKDGGQTAVSYGRTRGPPPDEYAHDAANQLKSARVGGVRSRFEHDGAGRLTAERKANGERIDYTYDARGRLASVKTTAPRSRGHWQKGNSGSRRLAVTWSRHYGPDGLLASVVRSSNERHSRDQRWELTWDRSLAVPQPLGWTKNGRSETALVRGVGLAFSIKNGESSRVRLNPLGDVVSSRVSVAGAFDPFGEGGGSDRFGLGFRGELHIGPTINLKARDLNPTLGRFVTPDPLTMPAGSAVTSRYAYAVNDPINVTDPLGLSPSDDSLDDGGSWRDVTWGGLGQALRRDLGQAVDAILDDPVGWAALTVVAVAATAAVVVTSPAWVTAAGIGALVAIGVTVTVGLVTGRFDPMSAAINGVVGGATAGLSVATGGFSLARAMALEGAGSGIGDVLNQVIADGTSLGDIDGSSVALNSGIGFLSAGIFTAGGRLFSSAPNSSTVYRVQGGAPPAASQTRIGIGPAGEMTVTGNGMLFVTIDDLGRAQTFAANNRPGGSIIAFEIDPAFVSQVRTSAVPQRQASNFPGAPQIADPQQTSSSFGLPGEWIQRLQDSALPGTGRIVR